MSDKLAVEIIMDILNGTPMESENYYVKEEWNHEFKETMIEQ